MAIKGVGVTMALCGKSTEFKQNCAVLSSCKNNGKLPEQARVSNFCVSFR